MLKKMFNEVFPRSYLKVLAIVCCFIVIPLALIQSSIMLEAENNDDPFRRSELTTQFTFEGYGDNIIQMGELKKKCGHLFEPEQLVGCTNLPFSPPDTRNLEHLSIAGNDLSTWLKEVSPAVDAECEDQAPCRRWLEEKERKESEPPINITFEEVKLP